MIGKRMRNRKKTPEEVAQKIHKQTIDNAPLHYTRDDKHAREIQANLSESVKDCPKSRVTANYRDAKTGLVKPMMQGDITALCDRLRNWADNEPRALTMNQFCRLEGMPRSSLYQMGQDMQEVQEAIDYAMLAIADRRISGAVFSDMGMRERGALFHIQMYDPMIRSEMEWESKLKQKEESQSGNITVVMQDFPASPLVPDRKKKEPNVE